MIDTLYIEKDLLDHPSAQELKKRYFKARSIEIRRYGEIFNRHNQNFRRQKEKPALIVAKKTGKILHPIPENYGIGAKRNFYFSHFLNCPFDCRYCFLQGMYQSGHYVFFANFEDFEEAIKEEICEEKTTFFSGYDGDSLALESATGFARHFLPFFKQFPTAEIEFRTKSIAIDPFLNASPYPGAIIAYSLNPNAIVQALEKKTPSLTSRLHALQRLQQAGWNIGLRFDPIIECDHFEEVYGSFFKHVFSELDTKTIHSVTLGAFRLPKSNFNQMKKNLPYEPLLALSRESDGMATFGSSEALQFCKNSILQHIDSTRLFLCQ